MPFTLSTANLTLFICGLIHFTDATYSGDRVESISIVEIARGRNEE